MLGKQRLDVFGRHPPVGSRRYRHDGIFERRRRRRIGAMRRFWHQHLAAVVAARQKRRLDRHHAAQFPVCAGLRAHGDGVHAGQFDQPAAAFVDQRQRALNARLRLQGMDVGKARQPRHRLVEPWIVLHGARAERIKPHIDGVVLLGEPHIMAHRLRLRQSRQVERRDTRLTAKPRRKIVRLIQIDAGHVGAAGLKQQRLLDHQGPVAGKGRSLRSCRRIRPGWAALFVDHQSTSVSASA